ncbi:MAG: hypothetical protein HY360_15345 [Verrucomicrobia bacterium]|nr:hypothetical protein [Verrucomicrobiota bacterium]
MILPRHIQRRFIAWEFIALLQVSLAFFAPCRIHAAPFRIETSHQLLEMREDGAFAVRVKSAEKPIVSRCVFTLTDGRSKNAIALVTKPAPRLENDSLVFQQTDQENTLVILHRLKPLRDAFLWQITIRAQEKAARRLQVQIRMETLLHSPCQYWDGLQIHELGTQPVNHAEVNNSTFPLATLYDEKQGVAIGLAADQLLSHAETSAQPGASAVLSYGAKVVVDPTRYEDIVLVLYPFRPDFGHLDAVEAYYNLFADFFSAASGH